MGLGAAGPRAVGSGDGLRRLARRRRAGRERRGGGAVMTTELTSVVVGDQARWLLPALVGLPLLAALVLLALRRLADGAATATAALVAALTLALAVLVVAGGAPYDGATARVDADADWIPALGVRAHLGVDGVSAPLVLLTALLGLLVCGH